MKLHLGELRRRGVFKTLGAYAVASWVLIEVVSIVAPAFLLPSWTVAAVTTILVLGAFPAFIFAWRYEFTKQGIERDLAHVPDEVDHVARVLGLIFVVGLLGVTATLWVNYFRAQSDNAVEAITDAQKGAPEVGEDGRIRSIAVLPFHDYSPRTDRRFLADGIAESILHALAQHKDLIVTARTSSFYFRDKDVTAAEIGRILNVQALLEGSVQIVDDRLRVTSQLIRTADQSHIWSDVFESPLGDVFKVQDEIAQTVRNLVLTANQADDVNSRIKNYPSLEAYELLLEAKSALHDYGIDDADKAIRLLRLAIEISPDYSDAYSWLSAALSQKESILGTTYSRSHDEIGQLRDEKISSTERALELNPNNALAILQQGQQSQMEGSGEGFVEARRRALDVAPNDPQILSWAATLAEQDLDLYAASTFIDRARAVDPSDFNVFLSYVYRLCAVEPIASMVETQLETYSVNVSDAQLARINAYWCDGQYAESTEAMMRWLRIDSDPNKAFWILKWLADTGYPEALQHVNRLHILMPRMFNNTFYDFTVFYDDIAADRSDVYQWHVSSSFYYPWFIPNSHALLKIQLGNLDGAQASLEKLQAIWQGYFAFTGDRYFQTQTITIYAYQAWLMAQQGENEESNALARDLLQELEKKSLTTWLDARGSLQDIPLLILLLNGEVGRAVQWLRDAKQYRWDYFQIVLASPIYAEFREIPEVAQILARMVIWQQGVIAEMKSTGVAEVLDPSLLLAAIESQVPLSEFHRAQIAANLDRDFQAAARYYEQAIQLEPQNSTVVRGAMRLAYLLGRLDDAIALGEYLVKLDRESAWHHYVLGYAYFCANSWNAAIDSFRTAISLNPKLRNSHRYIGIALALKGVTQSALEEVELEPSEANRLTGRAIVHHALGQDSASNSALETLVENNGRTHALHIAYVMAFRGEKDRAFEWLQKSVDQLGFLPDDIAVNSLFANLHDDPRWHSLLREHGQAPEQVNHVVFRLPIAELDERL